jgi:hypothetical protein
LLQALVGLKRNLPFGGQIPGPGVGDGDLLIGEIDRPFLPAPAYHSGEAASATVPFSGQGEDFLLQHLVDGCKTEGMRGLDQCHLGVQVNWWKFRTRFRPQQPAPMTAMDFMMS